MPAPPAALLHRWCLGCAARGGNSLQLWSLGKGLGAIRQIDRSLLVDLTSQQFSKAKHIIIMANVDAFDPMADFADLDEEMARGEETLEKEAQSIVHIRAQQRNGRKSVTTVQGLPAQLPMKKLLKTLKRDLCCNGVRGWERGPMGGAVGLLRAGVEVKRVWTACCGREKCSCAVAASVLSDPSCSVQTLHETEEHGTIVQLQGDQRKQVAAFLLKEKIVTKESLKVHGH